MKKTYNPPLTTDPHAPLYRVDKAIEQAQERLSSAIDMKRHHTSHSLAREVIDAFVTCSLVGENGRRYQFINPLFTNRGGATAVVECTVVTGHAFMAARFYTRNVTLPPGGGGSIELAPDPGDPANQLNMNCKLPPRVELNYIRLDRQAS